jgi:hypothetical protein
MATNQRRIKLIQPRLQLKLLSSFLGISALSLTLQFLLFTSSLSSIAADLPQDGDLVVEMIPEELLLILLISFGVMLPLTFFVGVIITFRVAGPLYRFEMFLKAIQRGEKPADCRIRRNDELQGFCELLNQATAPLRERTAEPAGHELERAA